MKTCEVFEIVVASCVVAACSVPAADSPPQRLKRADSFLGVHFDFHAGPDCTEVGKNTTPAMIGNLIDLVHPDYVQIDSKGHPGFTSYPTKVGNPVPGFVGDPLRMWRDETARRGVALYVHHSGLYDSWAVQKPGWAAIGADGKPSTTATSVFGPYADQLLIPQLRELAGTYGVDGVWVDGECWAAVPDYSPAALEAFRKATGIQEVPRRAGQPNWFEFLQFQREAFRKYLRHYLVEVKKTNPEFQLCSNWAYTDHMAEPVSAPVDFLSGDYSPEDSVNSARLSGRFLVRQGVPWDLMAWSFGTQPSHRQKSVPQLKREAAVVVALGGGFQAYFTQKRDGSLREEQLPLMGEVAKFCRERQELCHHAMPVPQVAVVLSTAGHYRRINGLFNRDLGRVHGVLQALLEIQQSVEVVAEHQVAGRLAEYPLVVVPEWEYLDPSFQRDLKAYAEGGGNLLLVGPRAAALFASELDIQLTGAPQASGPVYLEQGGALVTFKGEQQGFTLGTRAVAFGRLHAGADLATAARPAAMVTPIGKGRIAATSFGFGQDYSRTPSVGVRAFLAELVGRLFPDPQVRVTGSSDVDVCLARKSGRWLVNLVNTSGPHRTQSIFDTVEPVGPLSVSLRLAAKPSKVTLEPGGRSLPFEYRDGRVQTTVPRVEIHEVVTVVP